jgi:SNF2 family DNA or RNA helicase
MEWWLANCRYPPRAHQVEGVQRLIEMPAFGLFDEMGAGKTKQVIDAGQALYLDAKIDQVIVIAPAAVRAVWFESELGELAKHLWDRVPSVIEEYHARTRVWEWKCRIGGPAPLRWIITNYDFIRSEERLKALVARATPKTLLVLDESSAIKSGNAIQTKSCFALRKKCGRVVLLNGTPIANNPEDLMTQGNIMDPKILECKYKTHFRARYAIMGGYAVHGRPVEIIGWKNIPELQARFAPYILRRLKKDCLDLPEKLESVTLSPALTPKTWAIYREMREEMVVWLTKAPDGIVSTATQAMTKAMRLAQICSGFLGGVEDAMGEAAEGDNLLDFGMAPRPKRPEPVQEIGREKLDLFRQWLDLQLEEDPNLKLLVWCRFRPELERTFNELSAYQRLSLGKIWGSQSRDERADALRLLDPRTAPAGPVVVLGTPATGSMGLNLTAAHTVLYLSNDYSLKTRLQSEDRVHRPGQTSPVSYFDVVAMGPNGQKTIDHHIVRALRSKEDLANMTTSAWIRALGDE